MNSKMPAGLLTVIGALLALTLSACTAPLPNFVTVQPEKARAPQPDPWLMEPSPPPTHSASAASDAQKWQKSLTNSQSR